MNYAFIVPITRTYLHEGKALLRSLDKNSKVRDVHVLSHDLKYEDFNDCKGDLNLYFEKSPDCSEFKLNVEFRMIRTFRFKYAVELGVNGYTTVCLLDADMVLLRDVTKFFSMASDGIILVSNNNTLMTYGPAYFKEKWGIECDKTYVHPMFCTVPLFINPVTNSEFLLRVWNHESGNDLEAPNVIASHMNLYSQIHYLNSYCWTNIHHTMMKPETHVKDTSQGLFTAQGDPIYTLHGHWGDERYVENLMEPIKKNYCNVPKAIEIAENSRRILKSEYGKYFKKEDIVQV